LATNDQPLDLVGALEDLSHLGLPHIALGRIVARVAVAAQYLDCVGRHLHGRVAPTRRRRREQNTLTAAQRVRELSDAEAYSELAKLVVAAIRP